MHLGELVRDYVSDFSPAILSPVRDPAWHTLRYITGHDRPLLRLLRHIGLTCQHLCYQQRLSRTRILVERPWFPGYLFISFDVQRDNWGQVLRMPYAVTFLGGLGAPAALPHGVIEDLALRLPQRLSRPAQIACVAPGSRVRVRGGPFEGHEANVTWSDRRSLKVVAMLFNRPTEIALHSGDVEVL